ncbi:MAG: exopolysaccharide Pel transporter PelG [Ktedonobacterales bacterium]|nr:exopolysaccharide Pel transporter PelG [Ktedonobacterales bacterium]
MAGIGLRLQSVISKGTYLQSLTAYLSSAVISSGPWLSSVIALSVLSTSVVTFLSTDARLLLFATITYAFGVSLIASGAPQMVLTRYLADRLYAGDTSKIAATCSGMLVAVAPLTVLTLPYLIFAPFPLLYRLLSVSLAITLTYIWLVVVFLSAGRDYVRILLIFVFAYSLSVASIVVLGRSFGLIGSLGGFLLGQVVCLALLIARVLREFSPIDGIDFGFLRSIGGYWDLGLIGLLYGVGIWADNVVFWFAPSGVTVAHFFHLNPVYDSAKLIAYLCTIPASTSFLVHLESNFYRHYRDYFKHIRERGTLAQIIEHKDGMAEAAQSGLVRITLIQGSVGASVFLLAPNLARALHASAPWVGTLRILTVGVSVQIVMLAVFILLLYLDERRPALAVVATFTALSLGGSLVALPLGPGFFGLGYVLGAVVATFMGVLFLADRLRRLDFLTFMAQPLPRPGRT